MPSGGEIALLRLVGAIRHEVDAHVVLGDDGPLVQRLEAVGAAVDVRPLAPAARDARRSTMRPTRLPVRAVASTIGYTARLTLELRRDPPDLLHTNTLKAAIYGGVAGRLAGVPVVWHMRDRVSDDYLPGPAARVVRILARILPTAIIANSRATLASLDLREGRAKPDAFVVHDAAPLPAPGDERSGPLRLGMVGRLAPWKGQDVFLRALADLVTDHDVTASIVGGDLFGDHAYATSVEALVHDLGLTDRVELVGFVDDVDAHYRRFDIVVHASTIPEPFGQVVVEAMAAGCAVIASDAGGPAEVITDGVDGLLSPMGDVGALAERLRLLGDDPDRRRTHGVAARRTASRFTPEVVAEQVVDVYRSVARSRRRQ
jgi:glycosyltransferase involved in cell wall biosynthesis